MCSVYAGLFLSEDCGDQRTSQRRRALASGCGYCSVIRRVPQVAERGKDEGVEDAIAAKIHNVLVLYQPLRSLEGAEFRFHQTILYNSIYRGDDQLLVNTHVYGVPAFRAPVWHLRKVAGGEIARLSTSKASRSLGHAQSLFRGGSLMARRIDYHHDPDAPAAKQHRSFGQRGGDQRRR